MSRGVRTLHRSLGALVVLVALVSALGPRDARAQELADPLDLPADLRRDLGDDAAREGEHWLLTQYRTALATWLRPDERLLLLDVDTTHTAQGDAALLRALVGDRALRRLAPRALRAVLRTRDAGWLEALDELSSAPALERALRAPPIVQALRRRDGLAERSVRALALALAQRGRAPAGGEESSQGEQDEAAERALLAAVDCLRERDVSEASRAAFEATHAVASASDRAAVVLEAVGLLRELAGAARLPAPSAAAVFAPRASDAVDPFVDAAPAAPASPHGRGGAAGGLRRVGAGSRATRATAPASAPPPPAPPRGAPLGRCMTHYDCYGD